MLKNLAEGADGPVPRWAAVGVAVLASSLVFAFLHGGKVDHPSQYGYYLLAGLVLSGAYVLTGDLALPIAFTPGTISPRARCSVSATHNGRPS